MAFIFALLGLLAMLAGGAAIAIGWPAVPLEYGWTLVIAGSASASGGLVCLAIAGLIFETRRMRFALVQALAHRPADEPLPVDAQVPVETHLPADAVAAPASEAPPALRPKEAEPKPADVKPAEAKPAETKPIETKIGDTKLVETKPFEPKPFAAKPFELKPLESKSIETKPTESDPAGTAPRTETKPEPAAKIEPAMTFGRIGAVASSTAPRVELTGIGRTAAPPPTAAEPTAPATAPAHPAPAGSAPSEPAAPSGLASPRPLRFEPKVVATRPPAPCIEPALPGKADARPNEAEPQDDVGDEDESHAADGHNGVGDMVAPTDDGEEAEELRPARSFSVGETTFIVFTDGSIEARTPKGSQRFDTMEDVRAYLHQAVH